MPASWLAPRSLAGLATAPDFYFDFVSQVKVPSWTKGRVVLTGDAAWCAGPFGVGTSQALVGPTWRIRTGCADLPEFMSISQPSRPRHLRVLGNAGLVESHKEGRTPQYPEVPRQQAG